MQAFCMNSVKCTHVHVQAQTGVRSYWEICLVGKGRFSEGGGEKGYGCWACMVGSLSEGGSRVGFQSKCTVDRYMAQLSNGVFIN